MSSSLNFFKPESSRVSTNQINWIFFIQLSKIFSNYQDKNERICFLAYRVIPLIIIAHQNYFYQNFCLKKTFPEICNKTYLPIWNFKLSPSTSLWGAEALQFLHLQIAFWKTLNTYFFTFWTKVYFSKYLTDSIFLLHPVCTERKEIKKQKKPSIRKVKLNTY